MKSLVITEKRHSTREYKNKALSSHDQRTLQLALMNIPKLGALSGVEFIFVEDGMDKAPLLEGIAGYSGNMIYAPHYLAVLTNRESNDYVIAGYLGEWLSLELMKSSIGTCWIEALSGEQIKDVLRIKSEKQLIALIAAGYPHKEHQKSIFLSSSTNSLSPLTDLGYPNIDTHYGELPNSPRKSISEFVFVNNWDEKPDIDELEKRGFHNALFYMRLAPSYINRQPWHFLIHENGVELTIDFSNEISPIVQYLDAGIAMLYFEVGLHDSGIKGEWELENLKPINGLPDNYLHIAHYRF